MPQVSKAVVLCDSTISFYLLPFFDPIPPVMVQHIKGVTCFSHDIAEDRIGDDGTIKLCVVKRRSIQLYKIGELMTMEGEIPLNDGAITITRHSTHLCLADNQLYKIIDPQKGHMTPLVPTPQGAIPTGSIGGSLSSPKPIVTVVTEGEFLVVGGSGGNNNAIGMFVSFTGDPIRGTLEWSAYPRSIGVEFPYVAALLRNNTIEVHNVLDQRLLQTIPLNPSTEPRGVSFGHGIKIWVTAISEKLKRRSNKSGVLLGMPGQETVEEQRANAETARYAALSTKLLVYGKDSVMALLTTPFVMQVDALLDANRVDDALTLAEEAKSTMSPDNVHSDRMRHELAYVNQKSGLLRLNEPLFDDAFSLLYRGGMDPRVVIRLFPDVARRDPDEQDAEEIILYDGVWKVVVMLGSVDDIVSRNIEKNYSPHIKPDVNSARPTVELRKVLISNSKESLTKYLTRERERRKAQAGKGTGVMKAVDTALLKLYVPSDKALLYDLVRGPNDCIVEECAGLLEDHKRYYALSLLYKSKKLYRKVLEIWTKIFTSELPDPDFTSGLSQIAELLVLPDMDDANLVAEYAWWTAEKDPQLGTRVFVASPLSAQFEPRDVLSRLEKFGPDAVRVYLEYVVQERGSELEEHHTRLALLYVEDVVAGYAREGGRAEMERLGEFLWWRFLIKIDAQKQQLASVPSLPEPQPNLVDRDSNISTSVSRSRLRLIRLLQASHLYRFEEILAKVAEVGYLNPEEAIIHGKLANHQQALQILVHDVRDFVGAETYCVTGGQSIGLVSGNQPLKQVSVPKPATGINAPAAVTAAPPRGSSLARVPWRMQRKTTLLDMSIVKGIGRVVDGGVTVEVMDGGQEGQVDGKGAPVSAEERRRLFFMLLKVYLGIKDREVMITRTMHLLNTQGVHLDVVEVLDLLPDYWSIDILRGFLIGAMQRSIQRHREGKIILGLSRGENLMVSNELVELYQTMGPVTFDGGPCSECLNAIPAGTAFVHWADKLMHFECAKRKGVLTDKVVAEVEAGVTVA
ncbi:hypothetical protein BC936DRAFT_139679 [Jimgerdemannia flammicorona]|uniref:CNH domain-containing protein n=1 Tax=Jimgerdemannia flammicorona TaxID=994334 RepID=A0A433B9G5_9FUNG|nr:hypothetical protein BC936DRAFT_139679 [Jimgerdemannia flammicorona]